MSTKNNDPNQNVASENDVVDINLTVVMRVYLDHGGLVSDRLASSIAARMAS
jgi:hypothetical protein